MDNKSYDILKLIAQILLPFAAMVVAILDALGLVQYGEVVLAIATAIDTFLGVLLAALSKKYWEDKQVITEDEING